MPLGIPDSGRLWTRGIDGAARAADRREGSLVHGAADADLLVDARPVREPRDAELRQRRRLARRGRRAPGGSGRRAQYELGADGSARAGGAHEADPARGGGPRRYSRSSRPKRTRRGKGSSAPAGRCARFPGRTHGSDRPGRGFSPAFQPRATTSNCFSGRSASRPRREARVTSVRRRTLDSRRCRMVQTAVFTAA